MGFNLNKFFIILNGRKVSNKEEGYIEDHDAAHNRHSDAVG